MIESFGGFRFDFLDSDNYILVYGIKTVEYSIGGLSGEEEYIAQEIVFYKNQNQTTNKIDIPSYIINRNFPVGFDVIDVYLTSTYAFIIGK